jgi:DNA-binding response OmpR family regulator
MTERRNLLIVDDDPHVRRLLQLYLRASSFEVDEASTGEEAIEKFDNGSFDVVLLDLILPYYGGFRLCQRFKEQNPSTKIVIITGDDSEETRTTAKECGADDFMAKPFSADAIVEKLEGL